MSELKNCPFCGKSVAEIATCQGVEECSKFEECENSGHVLVVCNFVKGGCGAAGKYCRTEEAAITAWNTRTASSRFTAEEMEAMNHVIFMAMATASGKRDVDAIVTVKQMLEGSV